MRPRDRLDPEQLAAYLVLMEVSSQLRHAVEQQLRSTGGLSYVQFQILATLSDQPDGAAVRMTDLADRLVHSRSALTYQATQLEKAGLLARAPSSDDERSTTVTITAPGRERLERVLPGHVDVVHRMLLAALTPRELEDLTALLARLRDHLRATPPRSASRARRASGSQQRPRGR